MDGRTAIYPLAFITLPLSVAKCLRILKASPKAHWKWARNRLRQPTRFADEALTRIELWLPAGYDRAQSTYCYRDYGGMIQFNTNLVVS